MTTEEIFARLFVALVLSGVGLGLIFGGMIWAIVERHKPEPADRIIMLLAGWAIGMTCIGAALKIAANTP